jgi:RNA polymerase sigma factor (sigma-70 family)
MRKKPRFEELFLPHLDAAYSLARWIVGRDQDAQDIVQEAYARALKGVSGFRGDNPRAWLLTIVHNTAYSWITQPLTILRALLHNIGSWPRPVRQNRLTRTGDPCRYAGRGPW